MRKDRLMCKAAVKEEFGWTESMITRFMPIPDKEVANPYYRHGGMMKLYSKKRMEQIEETEQFKIAKEKSVRRKERAKKSTETKIAKIKQYVNGLAIRIPVFEKEQLIAKAIENHNDWEMTQYQRRCEWRADHYDFLLRQHEEYGTDLDEDDYFIIYTRNTDPEILKRLVINFIRHNYTNYESDLKHLYGKVGKQEAHDLLQKRINEKILETYEWLR